MQAIVLDFKSLSWFEIGGLKSTIINLFLKFSGTWKINKIPYKGQTSGLASDSSLATFDARRVEHYLPGSQGKKCGPNILYVPRLSSKCEGYRKIVLIYS